MKTKLTQPCKWHGGKFYLAKRIVAEFPPHLHFVETHFGMGAVLLARDPNRDWLIDADWRLKNGDGPVPASLRGSSEVVNDINGQLTNFWSVLRGESLFNEFLRMAEATPFSEQEYGSAVVSDDSDLICTDPVGCAWNFFVRYRQSRQGLGKNFATLSRNRTRRSMNEQVSSWLTAIEGLPELHERLQRVVILNQDACKVIKSQDGPHALYYCDPPYMHETRSGKGANSDYECEMTPKQHAELLLALTEIEGKFILSSYHSKLYDGHAQEHGWRLAEIEIDNKASSSKVKQKKIECLWMNF